MKKRVALIVLCLFFAMTTNALWADEISIDWPFAYQSRFQHGLQQIGIPEGDVLQLGCFIQHGESPIKEVTMKNLDTGAVLKASPIKGVTGFSDLYAVDPMPVFDPEKHMGVWEIRVKDQAGKEATAKTHQLNIEGKMPFLEGLKVSGNPLSPTITWMAVDRKDLHKDISVQYEVRLLTDMNNQFYKSGPVYDTTYHIPEGRIKSEDLSKIYVRVSCRGSDIKDTARGIPIELQSDTIIPLKEALDKQ